MKTADSDEYEYGCSECGGVIGPEAVTCPHCGADTSSLVESQPEIDEKDNQQTVPVVETTRTAKVQWKSWWILASLLVIVVLYVCYLVWPTKPETTIVIVDVNGEADVFGQVIFQSNADGSFSPVVVQKDWLVLSRMSGKVGTTEIREIKAGETYRWAEQGRSVLGYSWLGLQKIGKFDLSKTNQQLATEYGIVQNEPTGHFTAAFVAKALSSHPTSNESR